jgi:hypothetical protein
MEGSMRKLALVLTFFLLTCIAGPVSAKKLPSPDTDMQSEVSAGFGEILDLWRDGKFEDLYLRTTRPGKQSRESFRDRLSSCGRRPACCWEKLQDVTVTTNGSARAAVNAMVGMEGRDGNTEYVTRRFSMVKEGGLWKISMSDILSLARKGRKKNRSQYIRN